MHDTRHQVNSLLAVIAVNVPETREGYMLSGQVWTLWALEGIARQSCVRLVRVCRASDDQQACINAICTTRT